MNCPDCPAPGNPKCLGLGHPPVCADVRRGMPGRREQVVALATGKRREPTELDRLLVRADLCPSASGGCGCGSGPPRACGREGMPAEVAIQDCVRCVAGDAAG